jgi:hypothetical protein
VHTSAPLADFSPRSPILQILGEYQIPTTSTLPMSDSSATTVESVTAGRRISRAWKIPETQPFSCAVV